jgi:hypothetical protein
MEPGRFAQLYGKPQAFVSPSHVLNRKPEVFIVVWLVGMAAALDRIDWNITRMNLGSSNLNMTLDLAESWSALWIFVVVFGVLSGGIGWLVGGWWYRLRLEWSGARDPDPREARLVWAYAGLISALPSILLLLLDTFRYEDYLASWEAADLFSLIPALALFWSVYVSYRGATTRFALKPWPAGIWFLALPLMLYLFVTGLIGFLYSRLNDGVLT